MAQRPTQKAGNAAFLALAVLGLFAVAVLVGFKF